MSLVESSVYEAPGHSGSPVELQDRYDNFIGGEWVPPTTHEYRRQHRQGARVEQADRQDRVHR